jgi:hypothetical protein
VFGSSCSRRSSKEGGPCRHSHEHPIVVELKVGLSRLPVNVGRRIAPYPGIHAKPFRMSSEMQQVSSSYISIAGERGVGGCWDAGAKPLVDPSAWPLRASWRGRDAVELVALGAEALGEVPGPTFLFEPQVKDGSGPTLIMATALVTAGIDVKTAQVRLGHANPQITLRVYAQATNEADRAAAKTVGDLFW